MLWKVQSKTNFGLKKAYFLVALIQAVVSKTLRLLQNILLFTKYCDTEKILTLLIRYMIVIVVINGAWKWIMQTICEIQYTICCWRVLWSTSINWILSFHLAIFYFKMKIYITKKIRDHNHCEYCINQWNQLRVFPFFSSIGLFIYYLPKLYQLIKKNLS